MNSSYYQQVLGVTEEFLGLAAERFVKREIEFHINKKPEDITASDVIKLKHTTVLALGLLVEDRAVVDKAGKRFDEIIKGSAK